MEKTIEIPEGYEARIEGNKVILEPKESKDEIIRKALIELVRKHCVNETRCMMEDWLTSLKERTTWKPNDEQMHYLSWIANIKLGDSIVEQEVSKHLNELYDDLKKLKG